MGLIEGLMFKGGLYNNKPLLNFLTTEMADITPNQRFIDVGLTNLLTGVYTDFQASDLTGQELVDVMLGSFDYAGYFAPEAGLGSNWTDGSTIFSLDVFPAVNSCLAQGHAYEDIVIDVVLTSSKTLKQVDAANYGAMRMMERFLAVSRYYNAMDGLLRAQFAYPTVEFRHIIAPSGDLPENRLPLTFSQEQVDTAINMGYTDALNAMQTPASAQDTLKYFGLKKQQDARVKGISFEEFLRLQEAGHFGDYSVAEDKNLQQMFLQ